MRLWPCGTDLLMFSSAPPSSPPLLICGGLAAFSTRWPRVDLSSPDQLSRMSFISSSRWVVGSCLVQGGGKDEKHFLVVPDICNFNFWWRRPDMHSPPNALILRCVVVRSWAHQLRTIGREYPGLKSWPATSSPRTRASPWSWRPPGWTRTGWASSHHSFCLKPRRGFQQERLSNILTSPPSPLRSECWKIVIYFFSLRLCMFNDICQMICYNHCCLSHMFTCWNFT